MSIHSRSARRTSARTSCVRAAIVLGALGLASAACGPEYDRTEISAVKPSDLGGGISRAKLDVPEGLIVKAHVVVWNDDNEPMPLTIRSLDPNVVEVAGVVNDRDYAFVGRKAGRTQVEFKAEDTVVLTLEAEVVAQPELPSDVAKVVR
jgi:hypothetical protein